MNDHINDRRIIRVGSRGSRLAMIQSEIVMRKLEEAFPQVKTELITFKTTGDRIQDRPLDKIGGKGLFVRELDEALMDGRVDITVHSLKDLPQVISPDIPLCAFTEREDPRDVLILPEEKGGGARPQDCKAGCGDAMPDLTLPIGTSSLRRAIQIKRLYPGASTASVRGNVETRIRKLDEGQYSALIMAAAGLKRLGLEHRISRYLEPDEMIPASCQGIIAVQARSREDDIIAMLRTAVNDMEAERSAGAERAFIREIGADCGSPDTVFSYIEDGRIHISAFRYYKESGRMITKSVTGSPEDAVQLGQELARSLL